MSCISKSRRPVEADFEHAHEIEREPALGAESDFAIGCAHCRSVDDDAGQRVSQRRQDAALAVSHECCECEASRLCRLDAMQLPLSVAEEGEHARAGDDGEHDDDDDQVRRVRIAAEVGRVECVGPGVRRHAGANKRSRKNNKGQKEIEPRALSERRGQATGN